MFILFDAAGRRRSPATFPGHRAGYSPGNKGRVYPAEPPRVEEIIAVMRAAGETVHGARVRALVVTCGARDCGSTRRSRSQRLTSNPSKRERSLISRDPAARNDG
jgi:hypothetical protein